MMNTSSQHSKMSQLVCQNHAVESQKALSIAAFPESVMTLVMNPSQAEQYNNHSCDTAYEHVVGLAHALLQRLVEVLGEECGARVEECCERSNEGANETDLPKR